MASLSNPNNLNSKSQTPFEFLPSVFFCDNDKSTTMRNEMIKNQVRVSECFQGSLEETFFSEENIDIINKQLILAIFKRTKGEIKISKQSPSSLIIVMRYVFLEYARHLPYDIEGQLRELNCKVITEILPNILTNVNQRIDYLKEIQNPRKLLPIAVNTRTNRSLAATSSIFN